MRFRLIRLRFRRRIRKGQQQVEELSQQAEASIEQHIFKRVNRFAPVRRFVISWVLLLSFIIAGLIAQNLNLSSYYQSLQAIPGGIYNEGLVGTFSNANPLYATTDVDSTITHLVFAGLFHYDEHNQLVGDLAQSIVADDKGIEYTVKLKPGLTWQDGATLNSDDVAFTYHLIQNPDTQSPLRASWQGVEVTNPDPLTVVFRLPGPLAAFPYSLTNGIVPMHLLKNVAVAELRSADFNTVKPVGAGPFVWKDVVVNGNDPATQVEQIGLVPFDHYNGGKPKLQQFNVHAYAAREKLIKAFASNQLTAVAGLESIPGSVAHNAQLQVHNMILTAANMIFFKNSNPVLSDSKVRQALVQASNVPGIVSHLGYTTHSVREPLLRGQLGYDAKYQQTGYDVAAAKAALDAAGWTLDESGIRTKNGVQMHIVIASGNTPEDHMVMDRLQADWREVGVLLNPQYLSATELQNTLTDYNYQAVFYGISIGVDPDVFAYWDSSQADLRSSRTNLSEYKNASADASLEAGRTRLSPAIRTIKYKPFLQVWQQDNPALGLYQPRYLYLTNGMVAGLSDTTINTGTDRFSNVQNWEIRQARVTY